MGPDELNEFLAAAFPGTDLPMRVTGADDAGVVVEQPYDDRQLRPGGTISGPTLMTLADTVAYVAVVSQIGPEFLTVTSNLSIDFLRKPPAAGLRATGEVLKLGRRQAVIDVRIHTTAAGDALVARATCTYALPAPER
ncbi:MAG TPA: PaaI family thioesterase [Aquihabitans sp.]|nr:PaaI family thioesterase [Aquihabitans sp.]